MTIQFQCGCGHTMICFDQQAGQRTRCPVCGRNVLVPAASAPGAAPAGGAAPPVGQDRGFEVKKLVEEYRSSIRDGRVYFAPDIPNRKLRNALRTYAAGSEQEEPLILIDNTAFGGAKDGALLTTRKIYAHNILESGQCVPLEAMRSVTFVEGLTDRVFINDAKFLETNFPGEPAMRAFVEMLRKIAELFGHAQGATPAVEALKELKQLYDAGVITEEEFQAKRRKYLDQL